MSQFKPLNPAQTKAFLAANENLDITNDERK